MCLMDDVRVYSIGAYWLRALLSSCAFMVHGGSLMISECCLCGRVLSDSCWVVHCEMDWLCRQCYWIDGLAALL